MKIVLSFLAFSLAAFAQSDPCIRAATKAVDFTGTTSTEVLATHGNRIRVCSIRLTAASAVDLSITSNPTGTVLTKALGVTGFLDNNVKGQIATAPGENLGIAVSSSVHVAGSISYIQERY